MKKEIKSEYERGEYVQIGKLRIANSFLSQIADFDGVDEDELLITVNGYHVPPKETP